MTTRKQVITIARSLVGSPYLHQGRNPESGIDCVGILVYTAKRLGFFPQDFDYITYHVNPDSEVLIRELRNKMIEIPIRDLTEGDLAVVRLPWEDSPKHVGFLAKGMNEMMLIHALRDKMNGKVVEQPLRRWTKYLTHGFSFPDIEE